MSQRVRIVQPPPLSSIAPTSKPDLRFRFRFGFRLRFGLRLGFHSSLSLDCARHTPVLRLSQHHHGSLQEEDPVVDFYLQPITSEAHFDLVLAQNHHVVVVWMANWCRKCIYLKPKLEKLAADYYPRLQFYSVDVNTVSHKLVARASVTKMPTIQLWKDSKKQAEIIGGHKAYLVINEVQEMIENECTTSAAD